MEFQSPSKRGGRSDSTLRRWQSARPTSFNPLASGEGVQTRKCAPPSKNIRFQSPSKRGGRSDDGTLGRPSPSAGFQSPSKRGGRSDSEVIHHLLRPEHRFNPLASGEGVQTRRSWAAWWHDPGFNPLASGEGVQTGHDPNDREPYLEFQSPSKRGGRSDLSAAVDDKAWVTEVSIP